MKSAEVGFPPFISFAEAWEVKQCPGTENVESVTQDFQINLLAVDKVSRV